MVVAGGICSLFGFVATFAGPLYRSLKFGDFVLRPLALTITLVSLCIFAAITAAYGKKIFVWATTLVILVVSVKAIMTFEAHHYVALVMAAMASVLATVVTFVKGGPVEGTTRYEEEIIGGSTFTPKTTSVSMVVINPYEKTIDSTMFNGTIEDVCQICQFRTPSIQPLGSGLSLIFSDDGMYTEGAKFRLSGAVIWGRAAIAAKTTPGNDTYINAKVDIEKLRQEVSWQ